jgi:hypothetical protein
VLVRANGFAFKSKQYKRGDYRPFRFSEDNIQRIRAAAASESGEAAGWLAEFDRLKKLNAEIMNTAKPAEKRKQPRRGGGTRQ